MNSMENFFNWMSKPVPKEEIDIWFNVHNIVNEKVELYGDIFKSLNFIISDTYFSEDSRETKINLTQNDNIKHFDWCWNRLVSDFSKENIKIRKEGKHKDYFESFFFDTFYNQKEKSVKIAIPSFLLEVFDLNKPFSKSDLDILTELYKLLEKNIDN